MVTKYKCLTVDITVSRPNSVACDSFWDRKILAHGEQNKLCVAGMNDDNEPHTPAEGGSTMNKFIVDYDVPMDPDQDYDWNFLCTPRVPCSEAKQVQLPLGQSSVPRSQICSDWQGRFC
jgi:hypothetical protein